jgi:hypothetical protein
MTNLAPVLEPLSQEHQAAYHRLVGGFVRSCEKIIEVQNAAGSDVVEFLRQQLADMNASKSEIGFSFDVRQAAQAFHGALSRSYGLREERSLKVEHRANELYSRYCGEANKRDYTKQLSEYGKRMLIPASIIAPEIWHMLWIVSMHRGQLQAALMAAEEATTLSTPKGLQVTFSALWRAYLCCDAAANRLSAILTQFETFTNTAFKIFTAAYEKQLSDAFDKVLARMDAEEAEAARIAQEEKARLEAAARPAGQGPGRGSGAEQVFESPGLAGPSVSYQPQYASPHEDFHFPDYGVNPANGFPMMDGGIDIGGNVFGSDSWD